MKYLIILLLAALTSCTVSKDGCPPAKKGQRPEKVLRERPVA